MVLLVDVPKAGFGSTYDGMRHVPRKTTKPFLKETLETLLSAEPTQSMVGVSDEEESIIKTEESSDEESWLSSSVRGYIFKKQVTETIDSDSAEESRKELAQANRGKKTKRLGKMGFDFIQVTFPIRSHSYMECDKNFGLVNQRTRIELPKEWADVLRSFRSEPSPFNVEEVSQEYFRNWTQHFTSRYKRQCPFLSRPIRELKVVKEHPRLIFHRSTYNGAWESTVIVNPKFKQANNLKDSEFELPNYLYAGLLPISQLKYENLQDLTTFCEEDAGKFFRVLPHSD
ncbi:hypothetical protein ILUMI_22505 [Ignelater luminosus]|uniref:Uncharacterized protein n=1 Tax=Ignelater luminosus TaxID=2038154 RepID=A0A8K0CFQ1_IGNLU|nr:hypothetical protein ILUMI_22505 [Ignelater luminosus]